ncbi:transposase [Geminisphaera colitermitum]|uniref:transposase n=1 Tax=Geminisphaera colitermitum TaxID=1148786 RepID=UPI0002EC1DED
MPADSPQTSPPDPFHFTSPDPFQDFPRLLLDSRGILQLYRLRWQIELAFKRLKSLLNTGHVPKKDPLSSRSWLQAKLLTCLLIEKSLLQSEVFSPWGFILPD